MEQQPFLERAAEIQVADARIVALTVAVDAAVALFQPVRVVRQVEVDQVMAALLQVQSLGQRVGADQHDAVLGGAPVRGRVARASVSAPLMVRIVPASARNAPRTAAACVSAYSV